MAYRLDEIDPSKGITRSGRKKLEPLLQSLQFAPGDIIRKKDEPGQLFFGLARGSVSSVLPRKERAQTRIGSLGLGPFVKDMAVLEDDA